VAHAHGKETTAALVLTHLKGERPSVCLERPAGQGFFCAVHESEDGTILNRSPSEVGVRRSVLPRASQINLFGYGQRIVDLNSKIPHCAFQPIACRQ
jgi:hypothetical protein